MAINFISIDSHRALRDSARLKGWILHCVTSENRVLGDVAIALCSDDYIEQQNILFLDHHHPTDILTFSYNQDDIIAGDLLISTDTVLSNAKRYSVAYPNELHRVIIHGVLHLIGYDDQTNEQRKIMRQKEDFYLDQFKEIRSKR